MPQDGTIHTLTFKQYIFTAVTKEVIDMVREGKE